MTKKTIASLFSLIAISALTIGCGSSSSTEKTKTDGRAIDDYIDGATVCIQNTCVKTKSEGIFTFIGAIPNSPLVVSGGKIHGTNINFTGKLTAPAGSTVVSPLTTIIQSVVVSSGKSVSEANKIVKKSLGLDNISVNLTTYDPVLKLSTGTATEKAKAKQVFAQQTVVQTILATVSQTVAHAVSGKSEKDITKAVASQISKLISNNSNFNINTPNNIKTIIENTVSADKTISKEDKNKVTSIAEEVGTKANEIATTIDNAITSGNSIGSIRIKAIAGIKAQATMATAIEDAIKGDSSTLEAIDSVAAIATAEDNLNLDDSNFNTVTPLPNTPPVVTGAQGGN